MEVGIRLEAMQLVSRRRHVVSEGEQDEQAPRLEFRWFSTGETFQGYAGSCRGEEMKPVLDILRPSRCRGWRNRSYSSSTP